MPNYQESIIYKLCCKDTTIDDIYIGSTTNFRRRKYQHKSSCNDVNGKEYMLCKNVFMRDNGGWDNWDMIQIKEVSCNSKRELEAEERKVFDELKPTLNINLPYRTSEEERIKRNIKTKIYQQKNKDIINEKRRIYVSKNIMKIREDVKEYARKRRQIKILCECGQTIEKDRKKRHEKTKKHLSNIKPN